MSIPGRGWAYLGAVGGGGVSIAANVAHSYVPPAAAAAGWVPHTGAVVGAIFWPVALFVAVEIFARVAWPDGRRWTALRFLGLLPVAVVAAVVSYRHLSGLLAWYGEDGLTVVIGPLAVDGLMVMATGALIATGQRRAVTSSPSPVEVAATVAQTEPVVVLASDTSGATQVGSPPVAVAAPKRTPARTVRRTEPRATGRPSARTKVAAAVAKTPDATPAEIAAKLRISEKTVRRHLPDRTITPVTDSATDKTPDTEPVNGHPVPDLIDAR